MSKKTRLLVFVYIIGILWLCLVHFFDQDIVICPFRRLTNLPCPGCGMTRSFIFTLNGYFLAAFRQNPNIIIVFPAVILFPLLVIAELITKKRYIDHILSYIDRIFSNIYFLLSFILFELIIWIYLLLS